MSRGSGPRLTVVILIAVIAAFLVGQGLRARVNVDTRVFGSPQATVFTEDYGGPPVVGDSLTRLPDLAPLGAGNRTHEVRVDIVAAEIEIAPGVRYQAWTFGGTVPGPVLHVREGDRVIFTMKNRSAEAVSVSNPEKGGSPYLASLAAGNMQQPVPVASPMPHSMDFHSGTVAPNDKWRMIQPGQSIRFEWVANYPGVHLYHCGVQPILMHMAMGQYGVVVVSPRNGLPTDDEVDRSFVVVQSEFYLKPGDDGKYTIDYDAAMAKQPSHVAFNGHTQMLTAHALSANAGERLRLYFHNVGPSDGSSFHVVGAIFDRVFYEGNPRNDWAGMQTVAFGASNGGVVEFVAPEEGRYIMVDHEFADAQRGAVGYIDVRSTDGRLTLHNLPAMSH